MRKISSRGGEETRRSVSTMATRIRKGISTRRRLSGQGEYDQNK